MSDYTSPRWFNISVPENFIRLRNGSIRRPALLLRFAQAFNRRTSDGEHWWGFGILQVGHRHLFYIGHEGASILFIGWVPR